jgi:RHS repeat-associated protein
VLGRLTHILYADTTQNVTMTYDSGAGGANLKGRLASVTDPSGFVEYSYDDNGNVEMATRTVNGVAFVTGYGYDDAGNLRSVAYPTGHTVQYRPDAADPALVEGVTLDSAVLASGIAYAPFGPVTAMTLANGIQVNQTYDLNYQIAAIGSSVLDRTYIPDNIGNISTIADNLDATRSQSFGYDALSRLTNANGIYGTIDYTYDRAGNRTGRSHGTENDTYHYVPAANRLQAITGSHAEQFTHSDEGAILTRTPGTAQITYDYYTGTQRLKSVAEAPHPPNSDPAHYTYNSAGQRVQKTNSNPTIHHYDQNGLLIAETTAAGTPIKSYIWLHGQPLAMIDHQTSSCTGDIDHSGTVDGADLAELAANFGTSCQGCAADIDQDGQVKASDLALLANQMGNAQCATGSVYYYHNDHLGTPQRMTNGSGGVVWAADYLPFGQADVTVETVGNDLRFAGQYYDQETGLHYNYHRYYDPKLGRYLRADPIGPDDGINLYAYAPNSPINYIDQSGLFPGKAYTLCPLGTSINI